MNVTDISLKLIKEVQRIFSLEMFFCFLIDKGAGVNRR